MGLFYYGSAGGLALAFVFTTISLSTPGWIYIETNVSVISFDSTTGMFTKEFIVNTTAFGLFYLETDFVAPETNLCKIS